MPRMLARCLVAVVLVLAFAFQQTGMARLGSECDEDEPDACADLAEPGDCPPSCADCACCPGPTRVLLCGAAPLVLPATAIAMDRVVVDTARGRDARLRLERPPRASSPALVRV